MKNLDKIENNPLNDVWCLKYRPETMDEMVLPDRLKAPFLKFIERQSIPNILLISAQPGTGKTSIAKIIANELDACLLEINGSSERGIGTIKGVITNFVQTTSITGGQKIVFIDEADGLTPEAQISLKTFIEDYSHIVRFIFTVNNEFQLIDAMKSRFQKIYFEVTDDEKEDMINIFTQNVIDILDKEDIKYDEKSVFMIIKEEFPNYRDAWQSLNAIYNSYGEVTTTLTMSKKAISEIIKAMETKDLGVIKKAMTTTPNIDYRRVYGKLMDRVDEFKTYSLDNLIFTLANWNYKNAFVADPFLNFMGMCADLIINEGGD